MRKEEEEGCPVRIRETWRRSLDAEASEGYFRISDFFPQGL